MSTSRSEFATHPTLALSLLPHSWHRRFHPCSSCSFSPLSSCSDLKLRVRILIDGTLIIFRVKPEDAGKYTCIPSNSLGRSPSASAYLTVQCECSEP